ncbi:hypothetical protein SU69_00015 [Thermosipho melanesiensis]|uniref:ABC transporter related n=2 Tax=Thermosipho melanesiensis TaxID=46541 RepID=A0ABM6GGE5_9BACT|nr:hypothetical protein BW47_00015 [Thermosipho melanesiensis]OOC38486.1 hypothetical protein SU68_00015 [Thermosipho melanesiensis]OOC40290.1 hypothetical protein SU70_00015 [Thermosipho melanesiensis]OOC40554.1 hypothetical protein SU69_00015 [Thermosipho melanesiensis]OOC44401.1 hypothetical protein SU71_00015 [Thermosipho melanesiensis]
MAIVGAVGGAIVIFKINFIVFVYILGVGILNLLLNVIFINKMKEINHNIQKNNSKFVQYISNIISGVNVIKSFVLEDIILKSIKRVNEDYYKSSVKNETYVDLVNNAADYVEIVGHFIVGGFLIMHSYISFGELMATIQLTRPVIEFFKALSTFLSNLGISMSSYERISEILDIEEEELNERDLMATPDFSAKFNVKVSDAIEFENVSFSYGNGNILENLSFKIKKGQKVLIIGKSGIGKSTIFKLILKFYDPQKGRIKIFEKDIKEYSIFEIRDLVSYVPQDYKLFSDTIYENIRYGNLKASYEDVLKVAKLSGAHEFIEKFENGCNTIIEENRRNLSGGQKQKIAIARALLKSSPILLLDEITSSLDKDSKETLIKTLKNIPKDKMVLIISHEYFVPKEIIDLKIELLTHNCTKVTEN